MKKITKNNKGFSLIELIIVIAIMAVLVAIIAPNLTKYLGSSKEKTDKKNADEIASQLQTCITEYDTENATSLGADIGTGTLTLNWTGNKASATGVTLTGDFVKVVNENITSDTTSKENGSAATADIKYDDSNKSYTIKVTVGKQIVSK